MWLTLKQLLHVTNRLINYILHYSLVKLSRSGQMILAHFTKVVLHLTFAKIDLTDRNPINFHKQRTHIFPINNTFISR